MCPAGFTGKYCNIPCQFPYYGYGCQQHCLCSRKLCSISTGCPKIKSSECYFFKIKDCLKHIGKYYQNRFGLFFSIAPRWICQLRQAYNPWQISRNDHRPTIFEAKIGLHGRQWTVNHPLSWPISTWFFRRPTYYASAGPSYIFFCASVTEFMWNLSNN